MAQTKSKAKRATKAKPLPAPIVGADARRAVFDEYLLNVRKGKRSKAETLLDVHGWLSGHRKRF
jgi:hypothetical protein